MRWVKKPTLFFTSYVKSKGRAKMEKKWSDLSVRDKIGYMVAIGLILSGIVLAFLSFFLNAYNIATGVLIYIAQCFVIGGGLVGANVYFKSKWIEFNTHAEQEIKDKILKFEKDYKHRTYDTDGDRIAEIEETN